MHLLGTVRVVVDDRTTVGLRATLRDQALAYLAHTGEWVSRDRLGFLFWPDTPDAVARHNVRQLLKRIRRLTWLERRLEVVDDAVRWSVRTDVAELRAAVATQRWDGIPGEAILLPGFERNATVEFEEWLLGERRRIHDEWRSAVLKAATAAADAGDPELGARRLEPLLAEDHGDLALPAYMEFAARAGQRSAALAAFDRVATRLRDELGIDPPQQARELAVRLRSAAAQPVEPAPGLVVGRQDEVAEILGLLALPRCRMLTLLGPGGIGKSTLARMLLARTATRYTGGAVLVSLEAVTDPTAIPSRIAAELGIGLDARLDPVDELTQVLRDRRLLMVLDNAEHLPAGWTLFSRLLQGCPGMVMLVTSRERLRLDEEWVYAVGSLTDDDGVALFRQRARRVAPKATVTRDDALAVCRAVGGLPLAIELAAPWLRVMPAAEVMRQVAADPGILSGGHRDRGSRHRSIDAAMAHSWQLATPEERDAVEALSVFATPFSRELATTVAAVSPLVLRALIDKSLVEHRSDDRYTSHPLVRQYAAARLSADAGRRRAVRTRHAQVILGLCVPPERALALRDLLEDAAAAWQYAVDQADVELLKRSVDGLVTLLDAAGRYRHGLGLLSAASVAVAAAGRADPAALAAVRRNESILLDRLGRHAEAVDAALAAVAAATAAGDRRLLARSLLALAWARKTIDGDRAQYAETSRALRVAESLDDDLLMATIRNSLGCSAPTLQECREHLRQGFALVETLPAAPQQDLRIQLAHNLGSVTFCLGETDAGIRYLEQGLALARSLGRLSRVVECLSELAFCHAELGNLDPAQEFAAEAQALAGGTESVDRKTYATLVAAEIRRLVRDPAGAETQMRLALRLADAVGNESLVLRSLRLRGQLLIDAGEVDEGLRVLALVLAGPTRQGDYTSELINPRVWAERTAGLAAQRVEQAREWARGRRVQDVVDDMLARDGAAQP